MLRGKSSLFAVLVACVAAAAWSGVGMADDITPANVGTMATSAKSAQDYEALANYYDAQAKAAKEQADEAMAQYDAIHPAKGKRTGSDAEVIDDPADLREADRSTLPRDREAGHEARGDVSQAREIRRPPRSSLLL